MNIYDGIMIMQFNLPTIYLYKEYIGEHPGDYLSDIKYTLNQNNVLMEDTLICSKISEIYRTNIKIIVKDKILRQEIKQAMSKGPFTLETDHLIHYMKQPDGKVITIYSYDRLIYKYNISES